MDTTAATSLSSVAHKVAENRSRLDGIVELVSAETAIINSFDVEDAQDLSDRFRLWSGNIGASHPPTSKLSLEARLQDAPEVLLGVLSLLDEITEAADDLLDIISGTRENREFVSSQTSGDEPDIEDEGGDHQFGATSEAMDILDILSDCISSLLRISVLIQKATPRDRFAKALRDRRDPFIDQFDISYVQERYPKLAHPDKRWLVERLGRAITNRRQFIRYSREHRERLEQPDIKKALGLGQAEFLLASMSDIPREGGIQVDRGAVLHPDQYMSDPAARSVLTKPSTKASTLDGARLMAAMAEQHSNDDADDADDGRTYSSAASSMNLADGESRLEVPPLADVSQGSREFECILCCGIKKFTRERSWRRHCYQDLKAYVCTLGEGECGLEMFGDQKAWFDHELKQHRRQWTCAVCKHGPLRSSDSFRSHTAARHPEMDDKQSEILMNVSQSPLTAIPAEDCPFCDEWAQKLRQTLPQFNSAGQGVDPDVVVTVDPRQFRRHVGTHLRQLAIFAIPRTIYYHDEQGSGSVAGNVRPHSNSSRGLSSHSNLSFRSAGGPESAAADVDNGSGPPLPLLCKVQGENIPPSDGKKWEILWAARQRVLHSNNVTMRITWARDSLLWAEIAETSRKRWKREEGERPGTPDDERTLRNDALNIVRHLAGQDHPEACFIKGKLTESGKFGFREDKSEALRLYKSSSEMGFTRGMYRLGLIHEASNDMPTALSHYNSGAALGDAGCTYRLGMISLLAQNTTVESLRRGIDMLRQSADAADEDEPRGAYVFGMLLAGKLPDIEVPTDILAVDEYLARVYIEKAAYLGYAEAQFRLGEAYELKTFGCDFLPAHSIHYYHLAARQGDAKASMSISRWLLFGQEGVIDKNERLAFEYARDAATDGLVIGEFAMGYYHEIGVHVAKDLEAARHWYELAVEHGSTDAKERLSKMLSETTPS